MVKQVTEYNRDHKMYIGCFPSIFSTRHIKWVDKEPKVKSNDDDEEDDDDDDEKVNPLNAD